MAIRWPFLRAAAQEPTRVAMTTSLWRPQGDLNLEGSEGIFSAVTRLSNILASTPFNVYRDGQKLVDHHVSRLLNYEAAPGITPYLYKSTLETCRNVYGNGYALKVPGLDGKVERLDILNPERVTPMRNEDDGEVWYKLRPQSGMELYIHYREMIHVKHVSSIGLEGVNPIKVLHDALDYDGQMKSFSLQALRGINSCVTLEFPSNLGQEQKQRVIEDFVENYRSSSGGLIVLSGGVKANVITKSPVDGKVMDVERVTKGRIAAVYMLPPHMLGNFDRSSYSSNEQQMLELLQLTMRANYRQYEDEHELKLLTWEDKKKGISIHFDEGQMIIPTRLQKAQEAQYYVRNGVKTINEVRLEHGLPAVADGNTPMASRDLAPVDAILNQAGAIPGIL